MGFERMHFPKVDFWFEMVRSPIKVSMRPYIPQNEQVNGLAKSGLR